MPGAALNHPSPTLVLARLRGGGKKRPCLTRSSTRLPDGCPGGRHMSERCWGGGKQTGGAWVWYNPRRWWGPDTDPVLASVGPLAARRARSNTNTWGGLATQRGLDYLVSRRAQCSVSRSAGSRSISYAGRWAGDSHDRGLLLPSPQYFPRR